jgi:aspartate/glutamate racemase
MKIFFIHTVSGLTDLFKGLCSEFIPDAKLCQISDESLIQGVLAAGGITPEIEKRICDYALWAEKNGADVIQLTCSSVSPCADAAQPLVSVPVLKIDIAMAESAVDQYKKIGVIATAPTTLKPSTDLVRQIAVNRGRPVTVESVLCKGAFDAFLSGDLEKHDRIVTEHLQALMKRVEVVLLAQASMARVADALKAEERIVPILSSPRPAIERLKELLERRHSEESVRG